MIDYSVSKYCILQPQKRTIFLLQQHSQMTTSSVQPQPEQRLSGCAAPASSHATTIISVSSSSAANNDNNSSAGGSVKTNHPQTSASSTSSLHTTGSSGATVVNSNEIRHRKHKHKEQLKNKKKKQKKHHSHRRRRHWRWILGTPQDINPQQEQLFMHMQLRKMNRALTGRRTRKQKYEYLILAIYFVLMFAVVSYSSSVNDAEQGRVIILDLYDILVIGIYILVVAVVTTTFRESKFITLLYVSLTMV